MTNIKTTILLTSLFLLSLVYKPVLAEDKILLHFIHISDTHIHFNYVEKRTKHLRESEDLLKEIVKDINKIKDIDFVIATGDLVDQPKEELVDKFIEITMLLDYPLYVTLGNHDVGVNTGLGKSGIIKKFYESRGSLSFSNKMPYYSFSPKEGFTFICLDTTTEKTVTPLGVIDDEQLDWLKNELEANKNNYVFIALHTSPVEPTKSRSHFFLEPDKTKLLNIINQYKNISAIFAGDYEMAKISKYKKKYYITSPATVKYPFAFREIKITKGKRGKTYMELNWHTISNAELSEKLKIDSKGWKHTIGSKKDRERKIKLPVKVRISD